MPAVVQLKNRTSKEKVIVLAWETFSGMPVVQRPHGREEIVAKTLLNV